MIAADTNVVVRLLTGDDPAQSQRARALFAAGTIFLPKTVILESEWVLRRLYRIGRMQTFDALAGLVALPNVRCEDERAVMDALARARQGLDFADALHLASAQTVERFATFDDDLIKRGAGMGAIAVTPV